MPRTPDEAYAELIRRIKAISLLSSCGSLLHWDHQTYMPPNGGAHRAEQLALLAGLHMNNSSRQSSVSCSRAQRSAS